MTEGRPETHTMNVNELREAAQKALHNAWIPPGDVYIRNFGETMPGGGPAINVRVSPGASAADVWRVLRSAGLVEPRIQSGHVRTFGERTAETEAAARERRGGAERAQQRPLGGGLRRC